MEKTWDSIEKFKKQKLNAKELLKDRKTKREEEVLRQGDMNIQGKNVLRFETDIAFKPNDNTLYMWVDLKDINYQDEILLQDNYDHKL